MPIQGIASLREQLGRLLDSIRARRRTPPGQRKEERVDVTLRGPVDHRVKLDLPAFRLLVETEPGDLQPVVMRQALPSMHGFWQNRTSRDFLRLLQSARPCHA